MTKPSKCGGVMSEIFFLKKLYIPRKKNRILIKQNCVPLATGTILRYEIMYHDNFLIFSSIFEQKSESYKSNLKIEKRFSINETF